MNVSYQRCFPVFLLLSEMKEPYTYVYPLPFEIPSHSGHHSARNRVRCVHVSTRLLIPPTTSFLLGVRMFVLCALQIRSTISFF